MKVTGKEVLENNELREFLLNSGCRVLEIKWHDGSITKGYGKKIYIEKVNDTISFTEGLWSEEIRGNVEILLELPNLDLYKVFTLTEASAIWGKDESTIRKSLSRFTQFKEYRKAGRITLISKEAMLRVYGEPKTE